MINNYFFSGCYWANSAAELVHNTVKNIIIENGACNLMLTGGRSVQALYCAWSKLPDFNELNDVHFYFGDERCVPENHIDSNYYMVMNTLFKNGIPKNCYIHNMKVNNYDVEIAAINYEKKIPKEIDVLLLSIGDDGHIASLFPHSPGLVELNRRVIPVVAANSPYKRLTITPAVLFKSRKIFILAIGEKKLAALKYAMADPEKIADFPARLALKGNWILNLPF